MKGFFDKIGKDIQKATSNNNSKDNKNRGGGKSLGGSKPGKVIPNLCIEQPGPIGVKLENTAQNHAIVASVSPGGLAESIGLQRGDVICYPGTDGTDEIGYKDFLKMVKSNDYRPLVFDVRRMVSIPQSSKSNLRADADARRQAVIAAAEERNSKNKAKLKPIPKKKGGKAVVELTPEEIERINLQKEENIKRNAINMADKPLSEEAKRAVQAAKQDEANHSNQLGYNPYEVRKVTAGQASTASVAMAHGSINAGNQGGTSNSAPPPASSAAPAAALPTVQSPPEAVAPVEEEKTMKKINDAFDEAFITVLTTNSNDKIPKSMRIMRKLIINATTSPADDPKRKVRISDPNKLIQSSIIDMNGALELMMSVGFLPDEIDGKTFLTFDETINGGTPTWLMDALEQMEKYEK
mmetsp:Transcript_23400/g.34812  ORF Transcript_23400/g.34812 Transcript_23400/m.34812 type:complete len:410 (+) Transcript_23400:158-1387(+)|eukprot:CAMPEP_0203666406 /NCGR_PEP_ID=MMETSP0090-20130426/3451_1 /ASSEMBLY_ACC=CAM_ASM_001088 /TAXON_ID=426623 /ORGANISM="Chaetoceros affinis, Strain CCMP159" /LENGTH=409 /DNA_ID=CAMNT_0050530279 /DNA_START=96 /DNA_END=1325 /DNA_ORIENTATION=-